MFYIWKQKIGFVRASCKPGDHLCERPPFSNAGDVRSWQKDDAKARAVASHSISDEHIEHVRVVETPSKMWSLTQNMFPRRTLLNCLKARHRPYKIKMGGKERDIQNLNRAKQLLTDLKSMDVDVHDEELAMVILCRLQSKYEHVIVAYNVVKDNEKQTSDFLKRRFIQKQQRMSDRVIGTEHATNSPFLGLSDNGRTGRAVPTFTHRKKREHAKPRCWGQ